MDQHKATYGQEYEYGGLMAATWDLFRGDTSGWEDRPFFRSLILEHGQPALDVGCGTGRLLLDYLGEGIDVEGVDNSPEMLALCRRKAGQLGLEPVLYQQEMERLDLPRRYRTIIVPSSSFQLVTDPATAKRAIARLVAHLEPGGILAMPFGFIRSGDEPLETGWELTAEKVRPEDGALMRRWSRAWYDLENQLEHTSDRYEVLVDGVVVASELHQRSPATRWYTQEQAVELYRAAGLRQIELLRGFTREPATPDDGLFTVTGIK